MEDTALLLLTLGALLILGLATDGLARLLGLPRVTLLLLFGAAMGPSGLALLPVDGGLWFPVATQTALVMVGFLLGERFTHRALLQRGRSVVIVSALAVLTTAG